MDRSALKKSLREEYLLKRSLMPLEDATKLSLLIEDHLLSLLEFAEAKSVALYAGVQGEVLTDRILTAALTQGKDVYYPKTDSCGERFFFFKVQSSEHLTPGAYGVLEPDGKGPKIESKDIDLIIVPGIVFDHTGGRIGFGKGCYDKALSGVSSPKVALAFHMQVMDRALPYEPHDVRMDMIITQRGVERFLD